MRVNDVRDVSNHSEEVSNHTNGTGHKLLFLFGSQDTTKTGRFYTTPRHKDKLLSCSKAQLRWDEKIRTDKPRLHQMACPQSSPSASMSDKRSG